MWWRELFEWNIQLSPGERFVREKDFIVVESISREILGREREEKCKWWGERMCPSPRMKSNDQWQRSKMLGKVLFLKRCISFTGIDLHKNSEELFQKKNVGEVSVIFDFFQPIFARVGVPSFKSGVPDAPRCSLSNGVGPSSVSQTVPEKNAK